MSFRPSPRLFLPGAAVAACLLLAACTQSAQTDTGSRPPAAAAAADPAGSAVGQLPTAGGEPRVPSLRPAPPLARNIVDASSMPFAQVGGVMLLHVSAGVELIGFHEANHDGARQLEVLPTSVSHLTMESRNRDTGSRSAADIVVDPGAPVLSPVSGVVLRAGTYVLYCDYSDDFAVIAPDARPDWEVKVLHIDGVRVEPGDRVTAGVTVLAGRATQLPFTSQVDRHTAEPSWPHVHIEVVDPSIPLDPSRRSSC